MTQQIKELQVIIDHLNEYGSFHRHHEEKAEQCVTAMLTLLKAIEAGEVRLQEPAVTYASTWRNDGLKKRTRWKAAPDCMASFFEGTQDKEVLG